MDPVAPEHRHGGDDHGGVNTVEVGGFSFQLPNVDGATRVEAPTPTRGAPAALQHIPAEALLEAALESEAKEAMLQEINAELIRYGMPGDATPRSRMDVPPASGHADGDSLGAGLLPRPSVRRTVYALPVDQNASQGPDSQSAPGPVNQ
jgi:hypothetical protein